MNLPALIEQFITSKQSLGAKFESQANVLRRFGRQMPDVPIANLPPHLVRAFLGSPAVSRTHHDKLSILRGLYRFASVRGYVSESPLPALTPKRPPAREPHIFSVDEIRRLLKATEVPTLSRVSALTLRTILLLLYGTGLRISEATSLQLADVNLEECLLAIRDTKFYKSRLVPVGKQLHGVLAAYLTHRSCLPRTASQHALFLAETGCPVDRQRVEWQFRRLCTIAGVCARSSKDRQPRLHDLRHTFAVHRLLACYREGGDVGKLLPRLSTYMGHVSLRSTQYYLTLTPELLRETSLRFEQYAMPEACHD